VRSDHNVADPLETQHVTIDTSESGEDEDDGAISAAEMAKVLGVKGGCSYVKDMSTDKNQDKSSENVKATVVVAPSPAPSANVQATTAPAIAGGGNKKKPKAKKASKISDSSGMGGAETEEVGGGKYEEGVRLLGEMGFNPKASRISMEQWPSHLLIL
jgi:Tat protein secretion system quality control protein TatD with DNase activity